MIKIGLLGAAGITPMAIIEPARMLPDIEVAAVAARDPERARAFADKHNINRVEPSYESLLAQPDLDLVYIALPVSFHKHWAGAALSTGKHVLCEKPLVMNGREARHLARLAQKSGKFLIEAFHYSYHPYFKRILQIIGSGEIGTIRRITGRLHVPVPTKKGQIRHDPSLGGGALMDLACYPLHMIRTICGDELAISHATASIGPTGVDLTIDAKTVCASGIQGLISCSMPETGELEGELFIEGELGSLQASKPILPHLGGILHVETRHGRREEPADSRSTFFYQLQAIVSALHGEPQAVVSMNDSIANADGLDAIRTAAGI